MLGMRTQDTTNQARLKYTLYGDNEVMQALKKAAGKKYFLPVFNLLEIGGKSLRNNCGFTLSQMAAILGAPSDVVLKFLSYDTKSGYTAQTRSNNGGISLIHIAANLANLDLYKALIRMLVEAGTDFKTFSTTAAGRTVAHALCVRSFNTHNPFVNLPLNNEGEKARIALAKQMFEDGVRFDTKDCLGCTPLVYAQIWFPFLVETIKNILFKQYILDSVIKQYTSESNDNQRKSKYDDPSLDSCVAQLTEAEKSFILKQAGMLSENDLKHSDALGNSNFAFNLPDLWGNVEAVYQVAKGDIERLAHLCAINASFAANYISQTPAHLTMIGGNPSVLKWLLTSAVSKRWNLSQPDLHGMTIFHNFANFARFDLLKIALEHYEKYDINSTTEDRGRTVLHAACIPSGQGDNEENRKKVVALLIEKGANLTTRDALGYSALDYAKANYPYLLPILQENLSRQLDEQSSPRSFTQSFDKQRKEVELAQRLGNIHVWCATGSARITMDKGVAKIDSKHATGSALIPVHRP